MLIKSDKKHCMQDNHSSVKCTYKYKKRCHKHIEQFNIQNSDIVLFLVQYLTITQCI